MKKLINIFIVILFVLTLTVKADSGGPMFPEVDGEVKNDSIKCYEEWELKGKYKTFKKGDVITVRYVDGKRYEYYDDKPSDDIYTCYISANDLTFGKREYKLSYEDKLSDPYDLLVVAEEGVPMYTGPLTDYEKLDVVIPKGTQLKTHYRIGSYWYYVNFNNVSGYISSLDDEVVFRYPGEEMHPQYLIDDLPIYDGSSLYDDGSGRTKSKEIGSVPALTEFKDYWYTYEGRFMYITYNGISGFIKSFYATAGDCSGTKVRVLSSAPVYEKLLREEEPKNYKKVGTAEANKDYYPSYCFSGQGETGYYISALKGWLYLEYSGKIDFIETDETGTVFDSREYKEKNILERIEIEGYDFPFEKNRYEYSLEIGENVNQLNIIATPSDEISVQVNGNANLKNNSKIVINVVDDDGSSTYTINIVKRSSTPAPEPIKEDKQKDNSYIIWICLGIALLLVLTTIVIIILVNKKKKNKSVEVKEEINKEVPSSNIEQDREDTPKSEEDTNGLEN